MHTHVHTCTCTHTHVHMYTHAHTLMYTYIHMHTCTHTCTLMYTCTHMHTHTLIYTYLQLQLCYAKEQTPSRCEYSMPIRAHLTLDRLDTHMIRRKNSGNKGANRSRNVATSFMKSATSLCEW